MYLTFPQVRLVSDKQPEPGDTVIYERELRGERILTTDSSESHIASQARRYGVLYFDANDRPCVIPDHFSMDDAGLARDWR